jgi:hypothetical protein
MYDAGSGLYTNDTMDRWPKEKLAKSISKKKVKKSDTTFDLKTLKLVKVKHDL